MITWLLKERSGKPEETHIAIETPHGSIVEARLERGFNVYAINPKQLDRYRFTVARGQGRQSQRGCVTR
jgi:hypothetical protein